MRNKVKVLYIAGCGRTGSTILGDTLGQVEGFTHVGELLELWGSLAPGRPPCGCGVPVVACKMWNDVLKDAYGGLDESLIAQMLEFRNLETPLPNFLRATTSEGDRRRLAKPLAELERLYRAIQRVFNCEVIVDSSKYPMYLHILQLIEAIDLYVLHLVRDPRAMAYAYLHRKFREGYVLHMKPVRAFLKWNARNCVIEVLSRRFQHRTLHLRYEDFVANPRGSLQRILSFVDETRSSPPLRDEHSLNLAAQHTVSGNPSRFVTGKVKFRENDAWKTEMKRRDRMLVTAATWPLLIKYGYPTRTKASGAISQTSEVSNRKSTVLEAE